MESSPRTVMIRENRLIIGLLGILTIIALGVVLHQARTIVLPFALACFFSFVLNPLISFFERRKIPEAISILLALLVTFTLLNLFGMLIFTSIRSFAVEFPKYETRLNEIIQNILRLLDIPPEILSDQLQGNERFDLLNSIQNFSISKLIVTILGSILTFLSKSFMVLLFLLFLLIGRNQMRHKVQRAFRPEMSVKISQILANINTQIQKYILAKTFISLVTGLLATTVLFLFNVEFALIWGILTFLLNFIPSLGSIIATILPVMVAFIQFNDWIPVLWIALLLIAIQVVMGNFLDPRIVGSSLNLSPLVVIFSLIFWGWMWGIVGMFLAIPLSVIIKIVFENIESLRFISVLMSKG